MLTGMLQQMPVNWKADPLKSIHWNLISKMLPLCLKSLHRDAIRCVLNNLYHSQ